MLGRLGRRNPKHTWKRKWSFPISSLEWFHDDNIPLVRQYDVNDPVLSRPSCYKVDKKESILNKHLQHCPKLRWRTLFPAEQCYVCNMEGKNNINSLSCIYDNRSPIKNRKLVLRKVTGVVTNKNCWCCQQFSKRIHVRYCTWGFRSR